MVDTLALGASGATRGGSNPLSPTNELAYLEASFVLTKLNITLYN